MADDGTATGDGHIVLPPATEVDRGRVVRPGLWAFTVLLAMVGGAAVLLAIGITLLASLIRAGDPGLNRAVSGFASAARELPGVRSAEAKPGLGDLGTSPSDIYADVRLDGACDPGTVASTADRLRAIMRRERTYLLHPTIWCHSRGVTVSPVAAVTAQRLAVFDDLAADRTLRTASVIAAQRGDDPSPDVDNTFLRVELSVRSRTAGSVARTWLERLRARLPDVTVVATSASPNEYLDTGVVQDDDWTVVVGARDRDAGAVLRMAIRLERSPTVLGADIDGPQHRVGVIASDRSVLQELQRSLPQPATDGSRFAITITLTKPAPERAPASSVREQHAVEIRFGRIGAS